MQSVYRPLLFPPSCIGIPTWDQLHARVKQTLPTAQALRSSEILTSIEESLAAGQIESAVLASEDLLVHCDDSKTLVAVNVQIIYRLARHGDLVLARDHASWTSRYAKSALGQGDPLTLELCRWQLHFMSFTLMSDIAVLQYPQLLALARTTWGKEAEEYWHIRCEELISRSFERSDHHLASKYTSLLKEMRTYLGAQHPLCLLVTLFLGYHHWADGKQIAATETLIELHELLVEAKQTCGGDCSSKSDKFYDRLMKAAVQLQQASATSPKVSALCLGEIWANFPDVPTLAATEVEKQGKNLGKLA